jgi:hypothetical protein
MRQPSSRYLATCPVNIAACRIAMARLPLLGYSGNIETEYLKRNPKMNSTLALRAVTLLAFVAFSTALIVQPAVFGLEKTGGPVLTPVVALSHF